MNATVSDIPLKYWKEKKNRFPTQGISIDILTE
jgi:hypothetical protein